MLIEKKLAAGDVVSLRLVSGEELIAKLIEVAGDEIKISKPVLVQVQMVAPQQAGIGFAPFMVSVDESTPMWLHTDRMLVRPMKARSDITAQYIKMTTGLDVPQTGLIV